MSLFKRKDPTELQTARENEVKHNITASLSQALKTLQKTNIGGREQIIYSNEVATAVCNALEAVFLHGIKSTAMKKLVSYMGFGQQNENVVSINFWQFVVKFTHGDVTSQLKHLGHITTEIGLCRAWVRMALNDCLMESYVDAMTSDRKTLEYFYSRNSYLRDHEHPGILKTYLQGLTAFQFKLSYNASVLNEWGYAPLTLCGMIDTNSTPPPVIKSSAVSEVITEEDQKREPSLVEVKRVKSGSRGSNDGSSQCKSAIKSSAQTPENPMEEPRFGLVNDPTYMVTQSDFTRQDVEDFKKLACSSSPLADSECSSSSHISCPDPPRLNLSPAEYVSRETRSWSRQSDLLPASGSPEKTIATAQTLDSEVTGEDEIKCFTEDPQKDTGDETEIHRDLDREVHTDLGRISQSEAENFDADTVKLIDESKELLESLEVQNSDASLAESGGKGGETVNVKSSTSLLVPQADGENSSEEQLAGSARRRSLTIQNLQQFAEDLQNKVTAGKSKAYTPSQESSGSSQGKRKKEKSKGKKEKLKPELSSGGKPLQPALSTAAADGVDMIHCGLSHHRLSMPDLSSQVKKLSRHTYSVPNALEEAVEQDEDQMHHIYDGKALPSEEQAVSSPMAGNSLVTGRGWSSSFESELEESVEPLSPPRHGGALPIARPKAESFGTLLQNYTPSSSLSAPSIDDVLHNFPQTTPDIPVSPGGQQPATSQDMLDQLCADFEIVNTADTPDANTVLKRNQLQEIANEQGLDAQNFQCKGCKRPIGLIYGKPRVCTFDGGYYCFECHENDEYYIPALIIHNWDFRKQKVSKKNLEFLQEEEEQPHINLLETNPRLLEHVNEIKEITTLRTQLVFLKAYLFSCKQSIAEDLRRLIWPRDYLYESGEYFSLADLLQIPTGALAASLRKVIKFASKHVYGCRLCSQKGFICELCNNPKVIYAFETEETVRCLQCKSVFHKACKSGDEGCPKCHRKLQRDSKHGLSDTDSTDYAFHGLMT